VYKRVLMAIAAAAVPVAVVAGQMAAASSAPQPKPAGAEGVVYVPAKASGAAAALPMATLQQRNFQPASPANAVSRRTTVPFYRASFSYKGKTYQYISVGTNPRRSRATTTVPVTFIPVKIVESDGSFSKPVGAIRATTGSALFHNSKVTHGTQYAADTLRSSYWHYVNAHGRKWHVRLGKPATTKMHTVKVPANQGQAVTAKNGKHVMLANANWLANKLGHIAAGYSARRLVAFLTFDTVACNDFTNLNTCGIGGFHSAAATRTGVHTFAWASWQLPFVFGARGADIVAMSHEIAEWINDPFANDHVPAWSVPSEPQYGCSRMFEVGDPLVKHVFLINGLHYQDEANFSWFARQKHSIARGGRYSYRGTFKTFSPHC
jgi:hypothetical protein